MQNTTIEQSENVIALIRQHYVITILLPVLLVFNGMTAQVLCIEDQYATFAQMFLYLNQGIFISFAGSFLFFLFQKKWKASLVVLLTPFLTMALLSVSLDKNGIDKDTIYYRLNKKKYFSIIENSASVAQDGKAKLVQIPMGGSYLGCEKYLIYDETDEMANPKGNFLGIDYVTVPNSIEGKPYRKKAYRTIVNNVDRHTYVVYFCLDTGQ